MTIVRIIYNVRKKTFGESLEDKAQSIVGDIKEERVAPSFVDDDIALTLDHLARIRDLHNQLRHRLVRLECYVDTEIIQRSPRPPFYYDDRLEERDRLRNKLFKIEEQRRKLAITEEEKLQALHDRLLALMNKHGQLHHRQTTEQHTTCCTSGSS